MKKIGLYLIYIIILGFIIYLGGKYGQVLKLHTAKTYNLLPSLLFNTFWPIIVGIFIAIPEFVSSIRKVGPWKLNWIKLIVVGLPAFFFTFIYLISFAGLGRFLNFAYFDLLVYLGNTTIFGMLLGYTILSSFYKLVECKED